MSERNYRRLGRLASEDFMITAPDGSIAAAGRKAEEVYVCEDCGAVVYLRGNHDQWHQLNDSPLSAVLSGFAQPTEDKA